MLRASPMMAGEIEPAFGAEEVRLLQPLAEGPLSMMFVAERRADGRRDLVALKVLRGASEETRERLYSIRNRARRLATLKHRHIVTARELVEVEGHPALLTPWVDGLDLAEWVELLKETGVAIPTRVSLEILRCAAVALDAALNRVPWGATSAIGAIHEDLKPQNLMIDRDGDLRVVDFGTGLMALGEGPARTLALKHGLTRYLAPERRAGGPPTHAGDVYALGILGVELFRGDWLQRLRASNPAHDRHLAEVVAAMEVPDLRTSADGAALRNALLRMVAWDPDARPTAGEVAQTLRAIGDRTFGPSLESFAVDRVVPYLDPAPTEPHPAFARAPFPVLAHPVEGGAEETEEVRPPPEPAPPSADVARGLAALTATSVITGLTGLLMGLALGWWF